MIDNVIVIADDLTGAAEIAGIANRYGIPTALSMSVKSSDIPTCGVLVIATDTRSQTTEESIAITRAICNNIDISKSIVFRKTDSALRGHIATELIETVRCLGYTDSMLLAQNPSKGRIIKQNKYLINDVPINETAFNYDPEFPALTSEATKLVNDEFCRYLSVESNSKLGDDDTDIRIIYVAEAANAEDIKSQLKKANSKTLLAGGADLFECFIKSVFPIRRTTFPVGTGFQINGNNKLLAICGSTQSKSLKGSKLFKGVKANETTIPKDVFNEGPINHWFNEVSEIYSHSEVLQIRIGEHPVMGKEKAQLLKRIMAELTTKLVSLKTPGYLVIEGGATAFSILKELGWQTFRIEKEISAGVVMMKHSDTCIILKPGSYPWGNLFTY